MNKKIIEIVFVLIIALLILPNYNTYACGDIVSSGDDFLSKGNNTGTIDESQLKNTSDKLYNILFAIGVVVMFVVGTIIGIQFIVASAEEKAKVKESLIPYAVGCAVILGAFTIWKIVVTIGNSM